MNFKLNMKDPEIWAVNLPRLFGGADHRAVEMAHPVFLIQILLLVPLILMRIY